MSQGNSVILAGERAQQTYCVTCDKIHYVWTDSQINAGRLMTAGLFEEAEQFKNGTPCERQKIIRDADKQLYPKSYKKNY